MGLDSVLLIVEVEKFFSISLSNDETIRIHTVQDFANTVSKHVMFKNPHACKTQIIFYQIRQFAYDEFGFPSEQFVNNIRLNEIMPLENRELYWHKLKGYLSLNLPALKAHDINLNSSNEIKFLNFKLYSRQSSVMDLYVSDLIKQLLALNYKTLISPDELGDETEVIAAITGIIHESLGIELNDIKPSSNIVKDFGID